MSEYKRIRHKATYILVPVIHGKTAEKINKFTYTKLGYSQCKKIHHIHRHGQLDFLAHNWSHVSGNNNTLIMIFLYREIVCVWVGVGVCVCM